MATRLPDGLAHSAASGRRARADPHKQLVLVLDRAGWKPTSGQLLFLPAYLPQLHPAEHLWAPLGADQHRAGQSPFASIDALEDAQVARCIASKAVLT